MSLQPGCCVPSKGWQRGQDGMSVPSPASAGTAAVGTLPGLFPQRGRGCVTGVSGERCRVAPSQGMLWEGALCTPAL